MSTFALATSNSCAHLDSTWLLPGGRFGRTDRFELLELIGSGAVGRVFRVRDHHLDRIVAAKFIVNEGPSDCPPEEHLLLEARVTARLNHPNIVTVFDVGRFREVPYFLMEYVEGTSLDKLLGQTLRGTVCPDGLLAAAVAATRRCSPCRCRV